VAPSTHPAGSGQRVAGTVRPGHCRLVSRPVSPLLVDRHSGAGLRASLAVDSFGRHYWPMSSEPGIVKSPGWPPRSPSRAILCAVLNENYATMATRGSSQFR
jgi:hypothetical protein